MNKVIRAGEVVALSRNLLKMAMERFPNGTTEKEIKSRWGDLAREDLLNATLAYLTQKKWAYVSGSVLFITPSGIEALA